MKISQYQQWPDLVNLTMSFDDFGDPEGKEVNGPLILEAYIPRQIPSQS